jgi:hypothetical protein
MDLFHSGANDILRKSNCNDALPSVVAWHSHDFPACPWNGLAVGALPWSRDFGFGIALSGPISSALNPVIAKPSTPMPLPPHLGNSIGPRTARTNASSHTSLVTDALAKLTAAYSSD